MIPMRLVTLIAIAFVACSGPEPEQSVAPPTRGGAPVNETATITETIATTGTEPTATPGTPKKQPEITIESPGAGDTVRQNPFTVSGRARTFENNVVVRIRDSKNALIAERFTTARGDMGTHNPYEIEMFVTRHPGSHITIEALEYSAKDGSERSLTRTRVPFNVPPIDLTLHLHDPKRAPTDCSRVFPITRRVPKSVSAARLIVETLLTTDQFPRGAMVRSINLRNGVVTVDFNERMQNVGGSCRAQAIRASLEQSLAEIDGVRSVAITAMGSGEMALQP
jgi:hypothetical protein